MIKSSYFLKKMKDVKISDILGFFPMLIAKIVSPLYKKKYSNVWLICEEAKEARDNGYWFFKRMAEIHPEQKCIYAIKKSSVDYEKVKNLGEVVEHGSLKHWILYFTVQCNISSQKGGKPNAAICAFLELNGLSKVKNVFLQHGIIINNLVWLYAERSLIALFITSAEPEQKFVQNNFGYDRNRIVLTGMPRQDNLHQNRLKKNRVLIMPTWRGWFNLKSERRAGQEHKFAGSEYLLKWKQLLESRKLSDMIDKYSLEVIFYPHRNMQKFLVDMAKVIKTKAVLASWEDYDIQELLITSAVMITDYSSVFFDMVYMKKPVIFYQFDYEEFRKSQYGEGYFDYADNPFGKSYREYHGVLDELRRIILSDMKVSDAFKEAHKDYFPFYDTCNSERVFLEILKMMENRC